MNRSLVGLGVVWVCGVGLGLWMLTDYANAPGRAADTPALWPIASSIARVPGRATLIMLAHPRCPCTRASIGELALLMAQTTELVSAYVLFLKPTGFDSDWYRSDLWDSAASIPGVTALADEGGREALRFHAATSGQTILYAADGHLLFSGGITAARGHSGDNSGRTAVLSLLTTGAADRTETAVFGCALIEGIAATDDGALVCRQ
ncbi:MAG: RedB protein [Deltaproteobacteria bacterium]|nr:RedB protein [Deltaproteobacteria bacterium]MBI3389146.1 RedB protein [Deltaproteobacteria bacterium]